MFFVYMWCAWIVGCGTMAAISTVVHKHRARSEKIVRLKKENRHLKTVLEFYENIAECEVGGQKSGSVIRTVDDHCPYNASTKHDLVKRIRIG